MSVNKVILLGNVGKDPEVKYFDQDMLVAKFTLATTERGYTRKDGTKVEDATEWHNITAWRGLAKIVESYVKKGSPLYIEGKLRTRQYDDKDGVTKYFTEVVADNIELLGKKGDNEGGSSGSSTQPESYAQPKTPTETSMPFAPSQPDNSASAQSSSEDDLPF